MASKVVVRSLPEERFTQEIASGKHTLLADEPEAFGGTRSTASRRFGVW